mmetsp:Transcript_17779/g.47310  ORF Transcript_17779/g.47310 Transcript_17779/m.47310 type:complete len:237 (-) Transcript_17779:2735-3445(-)
MYVEPARRAVARLELRCSSTGCLSISMLRHTSWVSTFLKEIGEPVSVSSVSWKATASQPIELSAINLSAVGGDVATQTLTSIFAIRSFKTREPDSAMSCWTADPNSTWRYLKSRGEVSGIGGRVWRKILAAGCLFSNTGSSMARSMKSQEVSKSLRIEEARVSRPMAMCEAARANTTSVFLSLDTPKSIAKILPCSRGETVNSVWICGNSIKDGNVERMFRYSGISFQPLALWKCR